MKGSKPDTLSSDSSSDNPSPNIEITSVGDTQSTGEDGQDISIKFALGMKTEVIDSSDHEGAAIIEEDAQDNSISELSSGIIAQHMDITEPLTTLKTLLEQRLDMSLTGYTFFLQDTQELDASKNLVNQCVQGEGLVQINVQVIEKGNSKRLNIVDVLKPAEEIVGVTAETSQTLGAMLGEPPIVRKVVIPVAEEGDHVTRWVVSPEFKQIQEHYKIPLDPMKWNEEHVQHWYEWAVQHFNLQGLIDVDWYLTGKQLCNLNHVEFIKKVPFDPGDLFWTHLELLRKCKIVAVIQGPTFVQQVPQVLTTVTKSVGIKNRYLSSHVGQPRIAYEGCPGNRTGNNGQIQLWQFLLELLTDKDHREYIQWVGTEGEFKLTNPEMVAQLWGQRKNKPTMNYEKLSRALRYYYDGEMIAKVHGKRFVYKFVCDLKSLLGYDAAELNRLVIECEQKKLERMQNAVIPFSSIEVTTSNTTEQSE